MLHHITDASFEIEVMKSSEPTMLELWAPWCGPCQQMAPLLEELAQEYDGKGVKIAKLNVDENPLTAGNLGVMSIPTFILFKGGKEEGRFVGARSKKELEQKISGLVK